MLLLDTSVLVHAFTGPKTGSPALLRLIEEDGEMLKVSTLVLFEWLRGNRTPEEIGVQEALLPAALALPFGSEEAAVAAGIYHSLPLARGREVDIAIAATAIRHEATLWTHNPKDFEDIPGLSLWRRLGCPPALG